MGNNPSRFKRDGDGAAWLKDISDEELRLFPIETVTWDDVQEFLKKLNERERGSGWAYRLPTEAEWEYACREGAASLKDCSYHFYFGGPTNYLTDRQANFKGILADDGNMATHVIDGLGPFGLTQIVQSKGRYLLRTTRIGTYPPNKLGLYDMQGNVGQWCADLCSGSSRRPGMGRGGSWSSPPRDCRAAFRFASNASTGTVFLPLPGEELFANAPSTRDVRRDNLGFRLVRVPTALVPADGGASEVVGKPKLPGNLAPTRGDGLEVAIKRVAPWEGLDQYQQVVGGTTVYLSVSGLGPTDAKGIRTVVKDAKDDAGNLLRRGGHPPKREFNEPGFNEFDDGVKFLKLRPVPSGGGEKKEQEFEQKLSRCTPSSARSIKTLTGSVELWFPTKDPTSIITASFANDVEKPLKNDLIKAAGVEITLQKPSLDIQRTYDIKDPKNSVVLVEFFDAGGKKLESSGGGYSSFGDKTTMYVSFNAKVPADAVMKIYLVTEKSVVTVPFEFKDIPLPRR